MISAPDRPASTPRPPRSSRPTGPRRGTGTVHFWALAITLMVLNFFGLLMIISSSSVESVRTASGSPWYFAGQQAKWSIVGLTLAMIAFTIPMRWWRKIAVLGFWASLIPLAFVLLPGVSASKNGAARWVPIGPFSFQPSEFAKLTTVLVLAEILTRRARRVDDWRGSMRPALLHLLPVVALVMLQPNLGTTLIIVLASAAVVTVSGIRGRAIGTVGLTGILLAALAVLMTPFRKRRLAAYLDLRNNLSDSGYQSAQAMVGFANGGWFGRGLGRSTVKWGYLPYPYNDYIFAIVGEEFGLVGAIGLIAVFITFLCLGLSIAGRAADRFSMLVATGISAWLGGQAFLNMAAVTSVVPSTGVPLPFISFGGSAQIVNLVAAAILLNIARHPKTTEQPDPEVEAVYRRFEGVA